MSVTFDEEQQIVRAPQPGVSGLYGLVMRWGFAKDEKSAGIVLMIAAACMILFTIVLFVFAPGGNSEVTPEEYLNGGNIPYPPLP